MDQDPYRDWSERKEGRSRDRCVNKFQETLIGEGSLFVSLAERRGRAMVMRRRVGRCSGWGREAHPGIQEQNQIA
jgi:hypothetical protein